MSRPIKFRAWDVESQNWNYSDVMPDIGFMKWCKYDSTTKIYQYTGLKDRNGVEIYEGDIIREWWNKLADPQVSAIVYYKNGFYLDDGLHSNWNAEDAEVIGNIYSNPGLLEQPNEPR